MAITADSVSIFTFLELQFPQDNMKKKKLRLHMSPIMQLGIIGEEP